MEKLKPCPFCGNTDRLVNAAEVIEGTGLESGFVQCCSNDCGLILREGTTAEEAAIKWNKRKFPKAKHMHEEVDIAAKKVFPDWSDTRRAAWKLGAYWMMNYPHNTSNRFEISEDEMEKMCTEYAQDCVNQGAVYTSAQFGITGDHFYAGMEAIINKFGGKII